MIGKRPSAAAACLAAATATQSMADDDGFYVGVDAGNSNKVYTAMVPARHILGDRAAEYFPRPFELSVSENLCLGAEAGWQNSIHYGNGWTVTPGVFARGEFCNAEVAHDWDGNREDIYNRIADRAAKEGAEVLRPYADLLGVSYDDMYNRLEKVAGQAVRNVHKLPLFPDFDLTQTWAVSTAGWRDDLASALQGIEKLPDDIRTKLNNVIADAVSKVPEEVSFSLGSFAGQAQDAIDDYNGFIETALDVAKYAPYDVSSYMLTAETGASLRVQKDFAPSDYYAFGEIEAAYGITAVYIPDAGYLVDNDPGGMIFEGVFGSAEVGLGFDLWNAPTEISIGQRFGKRYGIMGYSDVTLEPDEGLYARATFEGSDNYNVDVIVGRGSVGILAELEF